MATETHIPESLYLKIGEKEDNALSSEILEEKVKELVGNKVNHVESSSQVPETVNTQVEAGIPTSESGTFFQALSVPIVSSNTPESFDATTTKDQDPKFAKTSENVEEISSSVEIENEDVSDSMAPCKQEGIKEQNLNEMPREFVKQETEDKSVDTHKEIEQSESVKRIEQEEETEEIGPSVEIEEKPDAITTDACISTQIKSQIENTEHEDNISEKVEYESSGIKLNDEEREQEVNELEKITKTAEKNDEETIDELEKITKNEEKIDEETIESDDGQTKKSESHMVKEIYEDTVSEMNESEEGLIFFDSSSMALNENEMLRKDEDQELYVSEKDQREKDEDQELYLSEKDQPESQVKTTKLEGGPTEVTESDDGQKENSESLLIKELCEETNYEKVESERVELSDSSSIKQNEKEVTILSNDQVQEKEQYQDEDVFVSTQAELEKETMENEDKNDAKPTEKEVGEEISSEKAESEAVLPLSDSMAPSKKDDHDTVGKEKGDSDGVTSLQDTKQVDIKETTPDQYAAIIKEETENKLTNAQQESEECQNGENDKTDQKPEESVKHEDKENEQEAIILEKDQGKDDFTSTQDVSVEGVLQEKTYNIEDIEREIVKESGSIEKDTQEIKSNADPPEKTEQNTETQEKNDEEDIESDDVQTKKLRIPMVEEICEETVLEKHEKAESGTSMGLTENEIMSKDGDQVQELYVSEKDQSDGKDVASSQNESNEDIKETTIGHVTTVADLEEEAEDIAIDAQEASEQYEDKANDNIEQNPEESIKDIVHPFSNIEHEEYIEEIKPSVEKNEENNVCISTQTESQEKATKNAEKAIEGNNEDIRAGVETEETTEQQGSLHDITSDVSILTQKESQEDTIKNEEKNEKDQEVDKADEGQDKDNVTSFHDTVSKEEEEEEEEEKEDLQQTKYHNESNEPEFFETRENLDEEIKSSVEKEAGGTEDKSKMEDEVVSPEKMSFEEQNDEEIEACLTKTTEDEVAKKDEDSSHISIQDTNDGTTKEEKGFLNESRDIEISTLEHESNEEQNSGLDEVSKEKFTDLNETTVVEPQDTTSGSLEPSTEDTSNSEKAKTESGILPTEDLESVNEIQIPDVVPNSEYSKFISVRGMHLDEEKEIVTEENSIDEKTEPLTQMNKEAFEEVSEQCESGAKNISEEKPAESDKLEDQEKEQEVISTDVCISTQTEPEEKTTENEEKNDEQAICQEIISDASMVQNGNEIASKDEDQETGQGLYVSEKGQDGEDFQSSKNASNEDINESTHDQYATTVANFVEEIITEKSEDNSIDAQAISSGLGQPKEQNVKEIGAFLTTTSNEKSEDEITKKGEDSSHDSKYTEEIKPSVETYEEPIKSDDGSILTQKESQEDTTKNEEPIDSDDGSKEKHDIPSVEEVFEETSLEKVESGEALELDDSLNTKINEKTITFKNEDYEKNKVVDTPEETQDKNNVTSSHDAISKDEVVSTEKMSTEEQKDEEIEVCLTKTTEDEVTKKDKDSSHISIQDTNDSTTKEEKDFQYESRDIEISTLEHEPTEEQNSGLDEVSKEKFTDLNETTEVEPQDTPFSSLEPSAKDIPNSGKAKAESEILPTEDLESVTEIQIPDVVPNSEDSKLISVRGIHLDEEKETVTEENPSDEKTEQTTEIKQETFEKTSSEKAGSEGFKLSDSSNMEVNENVMTTFNDKDQEKGQEVNILAEDQEVCEATSSEKAEPEDGVKHSESFDTKVVEDEIVSKEENLEKKQELIMSEVQGGMDDVIISDNVSNEDIKVTKIGQRATSVVDFEEGQDLSATTKEIFVEEEAEVKSVDAQEASEPCENEGKEKSEQNPEESVDKPVSSSVEDRSEVKDEFVSPEKMSSEYGQPKEQNIEEIEACLTETVNEKKEVEITKKEEDLSHESIDYPNDDTTRQEKRPLEYEPYKEDITPSDSLGTSTEDALAKTESENLQIEDLKSVSQVQIPEVVPESADVKAKEECLMSETATKEILSDENPEAYGQEDLQATEDISCESNVKTECMNEEPKEEIIPSLEEVKTIEPEVNLSNIESTAYPTESDTLPTPALESVCDVQAREISADSEDQEVKKECIVLATAQYTDENRVEEEEKNNTNELLSVSAEENVRQVSNEDTTAQEKRPIEYEPDEEQHGGLDEVSKENLTIFYETTAVEPQEVITPSNSLGTSTEDASAKTESEDLPIENLESVSRVQIPEVVPKSADIPETYGERELAFESTADHHINETVQQAEKSYITTEENVSHLEQLGDNDSPYEKRDMEENDTQENQLNRTEECDEIVKNATLTEKISYSDPISVAEDISCESNVKNDSVDEAPKEEIISSLEQVKTIEPEVNLSNIESTDYPSESETLPTPALEAVCDVQARGISVDSEDREEKASTEEGLQQYGELKHASESIIEEDEVNKIEAQPEQSEIESENIINEQESKLEHMNEKDLEDGKRYMGEDLALAPEITKNVILTDEDDKRLTELDRTSTSTANQKELANEIELSKPMLVEDTKVTESKAESQIELENIQPAEVKVEPSKDEIIQVLEDGKELELQIDLPEIEATDTPSNEQDSTPCSTQETVEEKDVRVTQITDREISPNVEFEKKENDVQTPEAILTEEHREELNDTCETLIGGESNEKKLISMVPPEKNTSPMVEDQANELLPETDKTEVEHSSISNTDQNLKFSEEGFTETFSEDQTSIKERYIEVDGKDNFDEATNEEKSGNEVVEDVIVSEVLLEDKTAEESKSIKDNINEEAIHNQLTSATDEVCENERSTSSPSADEVFEKKDLVEDTKDPKIMAENLNLTDESFADISDLVTEEKITETDANEEKETQDVRSEDSSGLGDMIKLEEKESKVSEVAEIVPEGRIEASAVLSENLPEDFPEMILAKHDPEITTKVEDVASNAECLKIEPPHIDTKEVTPELTNQENQKEEVSGTKQKLDAPVTLGIGATDDTKISQKNLTDDLTEIQNYEASAACTEDKQSPNEQTSKSSIAEVRDLNTIKGSNTEPQCSNEVLKEDEKMSDEEEEEEEDNEKTGDAPVMVEASKDMEVKVQKKSHNILSGVGSKVKHSIAKAKKAIMGKSSNQKPPSP